MTFPETSSALLRTRPTRTVLFVVTACILLWPLLALGQAPAPTDTAPNSSSSAQTAPQEAPAPPPQPAKTEFQTALEATASRVRDLLGEKLDPAVDPTTLFDVALDDERLIGIEKERLRLLLRGPEASVLGDAGVEQAPAKTGKKPNKSAEKAPGTKATKGEDTAQESAEPAASAPSAAPAPTAAGAEPPLASWTEGELAARLELDGARLSFYELSRDRRDALLASHQTRQAEDRRAQTEAKVDQAEQRAADAQRRQEEALETARTARTEALRVVAEEHARLLGVAREHAELESRFVKERSQLEERQETVIGWQRRVREMAESATAAQAKTDDVDSLYRGLRKDLRRTRDDLSRALSRLHAVSIVHEAGDDRLANLPEGVPAEKPRAQRMIVSAEATRLRGVESELRRDTADAAFEQALALNRARLTLYPYLSGEMRSEVSGFGPHGLEQAQAELRQVSLIARYRLSEALLWVDSQQHKSEARGESALAVGWVALKWFLPVGLFVWWRRRADAIFSEWRKNARDARRRNRVVIPAPVERLLSLAQRVRKPLEWILLVATCVWLMPAEMRSRLEVDLGATILYWTMGGALVVALLNAWADRGTLARSSRLPTSDVRLRSLKLVGRVVVGVALVLSLSDQLVGKGTVYSWVLSTCWFGAIPVVLVISRWWRPIVFERLQARRRRSPLVSWSLRQTGWRSLVAALLGGGFLLWEGTVKTVKPLVSSFDVSRRILAYLFRREMSHRADSKQQHRALPASMFAAMSPSAPSKTVVPSVADDQVAEVIARVNAEGGGVFAIVGERGAGKSTILRRIASEGRDVALLQCPLRWEDLAPRLAVAAKTEPTASLDEAASIMNREGRDAGLLFDDAHRLIQPIRGGMKPFDELMAVARSHSNRCSWIFGFDEVMWNFLERTRGTRPLFDEVIHIEPWNEEGIAMLLSTRGEEAALNPNFEDLIADLPADADEVEMQEAVQSTRTGYYRMIWDYSTGNPGIALHTFRRCLGRVGDEVRVKVFAAPDVRELETLPDAAVFVLRAVVQLEFAAVEDIAQATRLTEAEVLDALRFGVQRKYFELRDGRYWVTWAWFRPITRFLERRHLLFQ